MFSRFTSKMIGGLLNAIELQLFLMITSLPILVCWGMPISLLSILGNILFAPFLAAFLGISSIACLLSIFNMQFYFLSMILNHFTDFWYYLLHYANSAVLLYLPQPPIFILLLPLVLLIVLYKNPRSYRSPIMRIVGLLMICIISILIWKMTVIPRQHRISNQCTIDAHSQGIVINYSGKAPKNIDSWIRYTLIPECARNFGTMYCDSLIISKVTPSVIPLVKALIKEVCPQKIIVGICKEEKMRDSLITVLQDFNYKKMKGNMYALHQNRVI